MDKFITALIRAINYKYGIANPKKEAYHLQRSHTTRQFLQGLNAARP